MNISELDTPAIVVDLDRLAANIAAFQAYLDRHAIRNRPHIKTHKIPAIARMQLDAGAAGITCQKLGEAEIMMQAGINDIFLPYNIVGEHKLARLFELARAITISVTVDNEAVLQGLAAAARRSGVSLEVLVEFDTGMGRCGAQTPENAADLARMIARSPGLRFGGLMCYPFNAGTDLFVERTRELLHGDGIPVERVSVGGTAGMWNAHTCRTATEYRAGMYIYGDRYSVAAGAMRLDDCALTVRSTVVSRPTAERAILDGGSKTFSSDLLGQQGYGLLLEYPRARFEALSEEHGIVDVAACASRPVVGEQVHVLPNHCCVVTNLFNTVYGVRQGLVEQSWHVAARGAVR